MFQGSYDGLCGLYSSINLLSHLTELKETQKQTVVDKTKKNLTIADVWDGVGIIKLREMLNIGIDTVNNLYLKNMSLKMAPCSKSITNNASFFTLLQSIDWQITALLIRITGIMSHYTTVVGLNEKSLKTLDSTANKNVRNTTQWLKKDKIKIVSTDQEFSDCYNISWNNIIIVQLKKN